MFIYYKLAKFTTAKFHKGCSLFTLLIFCVIRKFFFNDILNSAHQAAGEALSQYIQSVCSKASAVAQTNQRETTQYNEILKDEGMVL